MSLRYSYVIFHVTIVLLLAVPLDHLVEPAFAPLPDSKMPTQSMEIDPCYRGQFTSSAIPQLDTGTLCACIIHGPCKKKPTHPSSLWLTACGFPRWLVSLLPHSVHPHQQVCELRRNAQQSRVLHFSSRIMKCRHVFSKTIFACKLYILGVQMFLILMNFTTPLSAAAHFWMRGYCSTWIIYIFIADFYVVRTIYTALYILYICISPCPQGAYYLGSLPCMHAYIHTY